MRRIVTGFGFFLFCATASAAASVGVVNAEQSSTRPMDGEGMDAARHYSEGVGRELLKEELGLDLNAFRFEFNPDTLSIEMVDTGGPSRASGTAAAYEDERRVYRRGLQGQQSLGSKFSVRLDQSGDLMRLRDDMADIPFGVTMEGQIPLLTSLTALRTKIWVPFSWRDEIKASAVVPLNKLSLGVADRFLEALNFNDKLDLRSDYRSRLGVNEFEAGLGTQWSSSFTGLLDLDYDYSQRYGQGLEETTHWLKVKKDF